MNSVFRRIFPGVMLLAGLVSFGFAQTAGRATAVIAGRVVVGEGGAPGIEIVAVKQETGGISFAGMPTQTYNAVTDPDGNYRIINARQAAFVSRLMRQRM